MNKPKAINPMQFLSDSDLLKAYGGALFMTIEEIRTSEDVISIDQAWSDAHDFADEILRRMKGGD